MQLLKDVIQGRTQLSPEEIEQLTGMMCDAYSNKPNIIDAPGKGVLYVGDLHGDLVSTEAVRDIFLKSKEDYMVFLGDYGDRGPKQSETFNLMMALALSYPERIIALRGNHESVEMARYYGFFDAVTMQYSLDVFKMYCEVFKALPLAAMSSNGVFSVHGGVPEGVKSKERIQKIDRHYVDFPDDVAFQMMWNDPREADFRFAQSFRGGGTRLFGRIAFDEFASDLGIKLMFRAHEAFPEGMLPFFDGRLISVFSASYGGRVDPKIVRLEDEFKLVPIPLR